MSCTSSPRRSCRFTCTSPISCWCRPEYLDAIVNNLALRLPGAQITPLLLGQARASLETIRMANAQVSVLSLPSILGGRGGDVSSWSGRGLNRAWIVGSEAVL